MGTTGTNCNSEEPGSAAKSFIIPLNVSPALSLKRNRWSNGGATQISAKFKSARAFRNFGFSRMEISSMLCWAITTPRTFSQLGGIHNHARDGPASGFSLLTATDHCQTAPFTGKIAIPAKNRKKSRANKLAGTKEIFIGATSLIQFSIYEAGSRMHRLHRFNSEQQRWMCHSDGFIKHYNQ